MAGSLTAHRIPITRRNDLTIFFRIQLRKRRPLGRGRATNQQVGGLGAAGRECTDVHDSVQFRDRRGERALFVSALVTAVAPRTGGL